MVSVIGIILISITPFTNVNSSNDNFAERAIKNGCARGIIWYSFAFAAITGVTQVLPSHFMESLHLIWSSGPWFNINILSYQYRKSHCGDKTILRPSYLHNGISYTGKMASLYWIRAQVPVNLILPITCLQIIATVTWQGCDGTSIVVPSVATRWHARAQKTASLMLLVLRPEYSPNWSLFQKSKAISTMAADAMAPSITRSSAAIILA